MRVELPFHGENVERFVDGFFVAVAVGVWLVFTFVWYVGGRITRATHTDAKVEQFLDTDGVELPDEERIKDDGGFREGIGGL